MKEQIMIYGETINLCILDRQLHIDNCYRWINTPEINNMLSSGIFPIHQQQEIKWFENLGNEKNIMLAIVNKEGKHIGNVGLHRIDYISRNAVLGIMIGEKKEWGKGIATEAEGLMINYAFDTLNLHKVTAEIFSENIGSWKAAKKNNAVIEGTFKEQFYKNGKYHDVISVAFFRN